MSFFTPPATQKRQKPHYYEDVYGTLNADEQLEGGAEACASESDSDDEGGVLPESESDSDEGAVALPDPARNKSNFFREFNARQDQRSNAAFTSNPSNYTYDNTTNTPNHAKAKNSDMTDTSPKSKELVGTPSKVSWFGGNMTPDSAIASWIDGQVGADSTFAGLGKEVGTFADGEQTEDAGQQMTTTVNDPVIDSPAPARRSARHAAKPALEDQASGRPATRGVKKYLAKKIARPAAQDKKISKKATEKSTKPSAGGGTRASERVRRRVKGRGKVAWVYVDNTAWTCRRSRRRFGSEAPMDTHRMGSSSRLSTLDGDMRGEDVDRKKMQTGCLLGTWASKLAGWKHVGGQ